MSPRGVAPYLTDEERRQRIRARYEVGRAIRRGTLVRQPCEKCGVNPGHAHHRRGYDRSLDVVWLCAKHHGWEHWALSESRAMAANHARRSARAEAIIERGVEPTPDELRKILAAFAPPKTEDVT